ncbi:MAG: MFS transporter [Spirochaetia bacterium]|nr:MFS transporter [Spirochaetia bacterium]
MLTRSILILSAVSLLTDISSEMLYPVMPLYLKAIGFGLVWIGLLEGFAEAVAGLSKGVAGQLSDSLDNRTGFVRAGYALSSISKPMLALSAFPAWIFLARAVDRIGKGLRSAPRDALLARQSIPEHRARIFGFHRAADTTGAVLGPLLSLIILHFLPGEYRLLFLIAFVPAFFGVVLTLFLKDARSVHTENGTSLPGTVALNPFRFLSYFKTAPNNYKRLAAGLIGFALFNSSDVFLILMMKHRGLSDQAALLAYVFYNCIFALAAFPAGMIADRAGLKGTFIAGLVLFACVYGGMAVETRDARWFFLLLALYGMYAAATEGIGKAWITRIVPVSEAGTAVGAVTALQSLAAIVASSAAGIIWETGGAQSVFVFSSACALLTVLYFFTMVRE